MAKEAFQKGSWPIRHLPQLQSMTVGYMAAPLPSKCWQETDFLSGSRDSWGWDIRDGVYAAAKEMGAEIAGY